MTTPQTYTVREIADLFRVSQAVILHEIRRGELHGTKVDGRWVVTHEELKAYEQRITRPATAPFDEAEVAAMRDHYARTQERRRHEDDAPSRQKVS